MTQNLPVPVASTGPSTTAGFKMRIDSTSGVHIDEHDYVKHSKSAQGYLLRRLDLPDIVQEFTFEELELLRLEDRLSVTANRNKLDIAKIRNTMKRVLQTPGHPVWLLVTGMPEVGPALEGDTQTWRRKSYVFFPELDFSRHAGKCRTMVQFFAKERARLECEAFTTDENIHRLMHASLYRLGIAIDVVIKAIRVALKAGSSELTTEHFAKAYKAFAGCPDAENPFLAGGFTELKVDQHLTRLLESRKERTGGSKAASK